MLMPRNNRLWRQSALIAALLLLPAAAHAQSSLGIGVAEPSFSGNGMWGSFLAWVNSEQQAFYRSLTGALKAMRDDPWKLWSLIGLSFAYGVFHAAGPGHGKAVISSYIIASNSALKRGVVLAFLSAFLQGVVAIALVAAAFFALRGTGIRMTDATWALETASFALIAVFGGWLLWRKISAIWSRRRARAPQGAPQMATLALAGGGHEHVHLHAHHEGHDHHHGHDHARGHGHGHHNHDHHHHAHDDHAHHHHGPGEVCETCGHAHMPDPSQLDSKTFGLRDAWSAVIAVGLRPCSGALIVMSFALLNGLFVGGALSVLAMSIGTAITVSTLAIIAVTARDMAVRMAGPGSAGLRVGEAIEIAGALLVMVLGIVLLSASLSA